MRALLMLLLPALAALADDSLMPRAGSGWAGFGPGTKVRIKRTFLSRGRVPAVTITTMVLKEAGAKYLTVASTSRNPVGIEQKAEYKLPVKGEAGEGETAATEKLPEEAVFACGKKFDCVRTRTTVTGPKGKRVITDWLAHKMRIKRTEVGYDKAGKQVSRFSMVLAGLAGERTVGARKVVCLKYSTLREEGKVRNRATAYVSRAVPGYEVRVDAEVTIGGAVAQTVRVEVLDFETK